MCGEKQTAGNTAISEDGAQLIAFPKNGRETVNDPIDTGANVLEMPLTEEDSNHTPHEQSRLQEDQLVLDVASAWCRGIQSRFGTEDNVDFANINIVNQCMVILRPILEREIHLQLDYFRHLYVPTEHASIDSKEYRRLVTGVNLIAEGNFDEDWSGNAEVIAVWLKVFIDDKTKCPGSLSNVNCWFNSSWYSEVQRRNDPDIEKFRQGGIEAHRFIRENTDLGAIATTGVVDRNMTA